MTSALLLLLLSCGFLARSPAFQQNGWLPTRRTAQRQSRWPFPRSAPFSPGDDDARCPHQHRPRRGRLFSLQHLVDDIAESAAKKRPRTVFVGGKGGVGKTTVSSALAVHLAADPAADLKVLVVSTDPAHSLGDALDEDLRKARGRPVPMTDPLTSGRLCACEVDAAAALQEFRDNLAAFDVERLADALGVAPAMLESLGLREFSGLLNNPPPGLDELVALGAVLDDQSTAGAGSGFDVVIVDTAPTGHTIRLLALPQFLDGLLGKLIQLRMKLSGIASTLQAFFGSEEANKRAKAIDDAVNRLERFRSKMARLRSALRDAERTNFVVVTVPTVLGVAETDRLVKELNTQGVSVTDVVVNQCVGDLTDDGATEESLRKYYDRRRDGQNRWIANLRETAADVSASNEYKSNGSPEPIKITTVPFFDVELVGVAALGYVGSQCFVDNPNFARLMTTGNKENKSGAPKVVICGGKGGVGKTTTSSSLAVSMAAKGHKVALISTDPAHSLGDAVDMDLSSGKLLDCPLIGVPGATGDGSLSVLEVNPAATLSQFKKVVDQLVGGGEDMGGGKEGGLRQTLLDLQEVFDTLPAGTDEVVALAKIVNLVKKGGFDRIVLDTAPTGHTLRMLSTPSFLADLIERLLNIADKINSNAAVKMFISSSARADDIKTAASEAKSTLLSFQFQMYDLEDLFSDAEQTEFLIVTVPTELAMRESIRLLNDLTFEAPDMPIKVRNVVVNQVLKDDDSDAKIFLSHIAQSQKGSIDKLEQSTKSVAKPPTITKVSYLDTEPRGVFGLKILADELLKDHETAQVS